MNEESSKRMARCAIRQSAGRQLAGSIRRTSVSEAPVEVLDCEPDVIVRGDAEKGDAVCTRTNRRISYRTPSPSGVPG